MDVIVQNVGVETDVQMQHVKMFVFLNNLIKDNFNKEVIFNKMEKDFTLQIIWDREEIKGIIISKEILIKEINLIKIKFNSQ